MAVAAAHRRRAPGFTRQAGFTLIEMLVVLVVIGLIAGLVIARGPQRSAGLDLRAATEAVTQELRRARTVAIAENREVSVAFDPAAHGVRAAGAALRVLPGAVAFAAATVRFAPDGSAAGGPIALAAAGRRVVIAVSWLTGRVSVADAR
jgi:general secretion pathway protein H